MTTTIRADRPGPASAGPGRGGWNRLGSLRSNTRVAGFLGKLFGMPLFWLVLILFILVPCASSLVLVFSPRLFDQGTQWFTLSYFRGAFTGATAVAITNSLWVSAASAGLGLVIGFPLAWLANRTTMPGRQFVMPSMWLVVLLPSWLPADSWIGFVQQDGVLWRLGLHWMWLDHLILGPFGIVLLLGIRSVPFTYLAITAGLAGLGQEFEDAARVHGAGRAATLRLIWPMLAPAIWSAVAIGFAEAISDYGVAATLGATSSFTLGTYQLFQELNAFPPNFPAASALGLLLVAAVAIPLTLQARALRGRSYQMLSGRTRQAVRRELSWRGKVLSLSGLGLFYFLALLVPAIGAVSTSLLKDFGASFSFTLANYKELFHPIAAGQGDQLGPLARSFGYGLVSGTVTVVGGFIAAWLLAQRRQRSSRVLDFLLLAAVALPSVVFAAGYIFAFNLPIWSRFGINLYQTQTLLVIAYIASSLPTNARVLVGAVSQLQSSLRDAARAHGAGPLIAWARGVLPVVSRPIIMAWLLTFCGVFLELPISQLLYAPSQPPVSVAINDNLSTYATSFGVGMAQSVLAVAIAMALIGVVLGGYRLFAPAGWRRIGATTRG